MLLKNMSNSTTFRVKRNTPARLFTKHNYRDAWPFLMTDFEGRCAYSMQHISRASGRRNMHIDHFNPHLKKEYFQEYKNLFLSTSHCNGSKSDRWPTNKERRELGWRFLDSTKEHDYGVHIFEDPDTHEVVGVTPAGRYQVLNCDLNAPQFIEDKDRSGRVLENAPQQANFSPGFSVPPELQLIKEIAAKMIPEIPYLSGEALEKRRAKRRERDALPIQSSNLGQSA